MMSGSSVQPFLSAEATQAALQQESPTGDATLTHHSKQQQQAVDRTGASRPPMAWGQPAANAARPAPLPPPSAPPSGHHRRAEAGSTQSTGSPQRSQLAAGSAAPISLVPVGRPPLPRTVSSGGGSMNSSGGGAGPGATATRQGAASTTAGRPFVPPRVHLPDSDRDSSSAAAARAYAQTQGQGQGSGNGAAGHQSAAARSSIESSDLSCTSIQPFISAQDTAVTLAAETPVAGEGRTKQPRAPWINNPVAVREGGAGGSVAAASPWVLAAAAAPAEDQSDPTAATNGAAAEANAAADAAAAAAAAAAYASAAASGGAASVEQPKETSDLHVVGRHGGSMSLLGKLTRRTSLPSPRPAPPAVPESSAAVEKQAKRRPASASAGVGAVLRSLMRRTSFGNASNKVVPLGIGTRPEPHLQVPSAAPEPVAG